MKCAEEKKKQLFYNQTPAVALYTFHLICEERILHAGLPLVKVSLNYWSEGTGHLVRQVRSMWVFEGWYKYFTVHFFSAVSSEAGFTVEDPPKFYFKYQALPVACNQLGFTAVTIDFNGDSCSFLVSLSSKMFCRTSDFFNQRVVNFRNSEIHTIYFHVILHTYVVEVITYS